ncbi:uncharacterized protein LOC120345658 [Styela clava]
MTLAKHSFAGRSAFSLVYAFLCIGLSSCDPPDVMDPPTVTNIEETTLNVSFSSVTDVVAYYITVAPRHASFAPRTFKANTAGSVLVENLVGNTIYYVSVKGENATGEIGPDSNATSAHTLPGPPTFTLSDPLPTSVYIAFQLNNYARVSEWTIQYQEVTSSNPSVITTSSGQYYQYWLSKLIPDTDYKIRARASQLYGGTNISDTRYSSWQNFKTASLSIFGRVDLADETYSPSYSNDFSEEWNATLSIITEAYSAMNITYNEITIIEIEEEGGTPLVFYEIKVKEKSLPSLVNYTLTGESFNNSFINNGDECVGTPGIYVEVGVGVEESDTTITLKYSIHNTSSPMTLNDVEYRMYITQEDNSTTTIPLTISGSDGKLDPTTSIIMQANGIITPGSSKDEELATLTSNSAAGLTPGFLIKDVLIGSRVKLYTRYFSAQNLSTANTVDHLFHSTELNASVVNKTAEAITYTSSSDGTSVTLNIPSLKKAIRYEILDDSGSVVATLEEEEIDGSDILKIPIASMTNGTEVTFELNIMTRLQDDQTALATSSYEIRVTPNSDQCSKCSTNASCVGLTDRSGDVICTCNDGFGGDGTTCYFITTTTAATTAATTESDTTTAVDPTTAATFQPSTTMDEPTTAATSQPSTTIAEPTTAATSQPSTTIAEPTTAATSQPSTTIVEPTTAATSQPSTTIAEPTTIATSQPSTTIAEPTTAATSQPSTTIAEPTTAATSQPSTTIAEPTTAATSQPSTTIVEPNTAATSQPSTTIAEPTTAATSQPSTTIAEPTTAATSQPSTTIAEPTTAETPQPSTTITEPTTAETLQPSTTIAEPTTAATSQSSTTITGPTTAATAQSSTTSSEPSTAGTSQSSTTNSEPTTAATSQPSTTITEPTTAATSQPSTASSEPSTAETSQPSTTITEPTTAATSQPCTPITEATPTTAKPATDSTASTTVSESSTTTNNSQPGCSHFVIHHKMDYGI